jgi:hypothetical protein
VSAASGTISLPSSIPMVGLPPVDWKVTSFIAFPPS